MRALPIEVAAFLVVCASCTTIQSSSLKTSGMSAYMQVVGDGTGQTKVSAQFNVDNNSTDFVDLSAGDSVIASVGGMSQPMARVTFLGTVSYETSFTGEDADGTQYTIALSRTTDVSAPSSTCTMPNPFTITAPTGNSAFSRATGDIVVTYDTVGTQDSMTWSVGGDCVKGMVGGSVANDAGSFTITKGTLVSTDATQSNVTCQAHITLTRERPGQLDPHYGSGGNIAAQQVRTVTFNSTP
jgi:hypothetical protein